MDFADPPLEPEAIEEDFFEIAPKDLSTIGGGGLPEELELPEELDDFEELDPENEELDEEFVTGIFPLSGSLNPESFELFSG